MIAAADDSGCAGRSALLGQVSAALARHGAAALHGPAGSGKSALVAELTAAAAGDGALVLRARPEPRDLDLPYSGLAELLAGAGPDVARTLHGPQADSLAAVLRNRPAPPGGHDPVGVRLALRDLLDRLAGSAPVLLAVDNAQWLDAASFDAVRGALRIVRSSEIRLLAAERGAQAASAAAGLCGTTRQFEVVPLAVEHVAELVGGLGLPTRWVGRVHALSGGNPAIALDVARWVLAAAPDARSPDPLALPPAAVAVVEDWLACLPPATRRTLVAASLARRPTGTLLGRVYPATAAQDMATAARHRLVTVEHDRVRFTALAIARVLADGTTGAERAATHRLLAGAADDPAEASWHNAKATSGVNTELADRLAEAATTAHRRGDHAFAAELGLLAVQRMPHGDPARAIGRMVTVAEHAGLAGRADLARRAAGHVLDRSGDPPLRVRVRLAIIDSIGQELDGTDELFARAIADAGDDQALLAAIHLRLAMKAQLADGDIRRAAAEAGEAAALAERQRLPGLQTTALTLRARMFRALGHPSAEDILARAMAVPRGPDDVEPANLVHFVAARHALFDDRLTAARDGLLALLPAMEHSGATDNVVEILRSLVEVEAKAGLCTSCLEHARRVERLRSAAGLSSGLTWYALSVAELTGGDFDRATALAALGTAASREEHDMVFLPRNLYVHGMVMLATGRAAAAVRLLGEVRRWAADEQIADPSILRWQGELAEALVADGSPAEADELVAATRPVARVLGRHGVLAALDRAEASAAVARGEVSTADTLLAAAASRFAELGLSIEYGRTLLARGRFERSRRRAAAARSALRGAEEHFTGLGARPWALLAARELEQLDARPVAPISAHGLTEAESELVALIAQGVSNREAAARLFLSVKTIEGRLTRIYRKLGVRSRAQLVALLRGQPQPTRPYPAASGQD